MKVSKKIEVRPGRGNLKRMAEEVARGDIRSAIVYAGMHAKNRQKTARAARNGG